jgi:hypothetical protein
VVVHACRPGGRRFLACGPTAAVRGREAGGGGVGPPRERERGRKEADSYMEKNQIGIDTGFQNYDNLCGGIEKHNEPIIFLARLKFPHGF